MKKRTFIPALAGVFLMLTGCADLLSSLRRDTDAADWDQPTSGGMWAERGLLNDDGSGRNPASDAPRGYDGQAPRDWVSPGQDEASQVDRYQGTGSSSFGTTYSGNPNMPPTTRRMYKQGSRATRSDFVDEGTGEGSLWASDGQTNYYFTKNKIRGVGDIVSVLIETGILKDIHVEVARTLSQPEREIEIAAAQERFQKAASNTDRTPSSASSPNRPAASGPSNPTSGDAAPGANMNTFAGNAEVSVRKATDADIDVGPAVELKEQDVIMAEIIERYPNGNYKLRGTKRVRYRAGTRLLTLLGVARSVDITEADTIGSGKLYEYRLEVIR